MAISDQIQMLISAFIFGLLFQATIAALVLHINGHGLTIFKDGRRLVLVLFLTSTALWAQVDFINFAIPSTSPNACQVTIIASTAFDQAARTLIGGFLLWSVGHVKKTPVESSGLCALMGIRTIMGVIFVVYARPQFAPVCVARSDMLAVSVTVMVLDMIIIGVLAIRVFTSGLLNVVKEVRSRTKREQSRAFIYCTAGLFLWTLTSSAMIVGMPSIALLLRTGLPAIGLMLLILILTVYTGALVLPRDDDSTTPEARSPFVTPPTHSLSILSDDDGSPIHETGYTRTANLFVVNPSNTPHESSAIAYLEDVKAEDNNYTGQRSKGIRAVQSEEVSSFNAEDVASNRASSGVFRSLSAATLEAIGSAAFLAAPRQAPVPYSASRTDQTRALPSIDISSTEARQKRPRFGWSKKSAERGVQKIVISNPVVDNAKSLSAQPFARIRTIDLVAAAASEQERREGARNKQLVAKRPAPPPPTASEAWRKSSSTRRKEVPRGTSAPLTLNISKKISDESRLSVTINGNSTSASLSPGREDVRRRSPRSIKTLEGDIEKACFLASRPSTIVVPKKESQQTVMYVNDIVYNHPSMVKSIIQEAPTTLRKSKSEHHQKPANSTKSATTQPDSIMHRPRPYTRDSENDHVFFASEPSPRHKRSRSSPSARTKKNIPPSHSTVTDLPTLPQRPTTAAGLKKLLPNDTRSMTADEKISLLFPAPPGVHQVHSRRSSVPSLPRIPSSILLGDSFTKMLTDQEVQEHRASKRTTISFGSQIEKDGVTPIAETPIINEHGIYRFSANTYRTLAESPRDSQIPELPGKVQNAEQPNSNEMLSQSSNSQRHSAITSSSSDVDGSHEDSKSAWASIHSPIPAIDVVTAQRTARETYIKMRKEAVGGSEGETHGIFHAPSPAEDGRNEVGDGEGFMTVMFSMGDIEPPPANMRSFLLNPSPVMPDNEIFIPTESDVWHRRIGDELPAFSQRRKYLRSRTMPPPTPLLLGLNRRQVPVIVREPFVEEQEESPETVLKELQAQLNRFDGASRQSVGSLVHPTPKDSLKPSTTLSNNELGLIANLEKEMGQQETLWMQMQHNFGRDSNSIIMTPQVAEYTPGALPSPRSETSSRKTPRSVNRRPRIPSKDGESASANWSHNPNISTVNIWKQRLADAEMEFEENVPVMLGAGAVNFLSISKAQLGSPTPPESLSSESDPETEMDYDTDENIDDWEFARTAPSTESNPKALWVPKPSAPSLRVGPLWPATEAISMARTTSSEPAAKGLRPVKRRDQHTLPIFSSRLWSKPTLNVNRHPSGLWGSRKARPKTTTTRPKAQRPQRKSKRITFLPDILENPSPLPHKRDTLGIFQFPWGEKSDSAVYDPIPVPNRASLSSFVWNCPFDPKPPRSDPEPAEYSSSFFDEYEDDYEEGSEVNSDDDFDESTLWEIATLLNSQDVPSRNSLFPCPRIIEDYDDENDSEPDVTESTNNPNQSTRTSAWPTMVKFIPIKPLKPLPQLSILQESDDDSGQTHVAAEKAIQHAAPAIRQAYLPVLDDALRGKPCEAAGQGSQPRPKTDAGVHWDKPMGAVSSLAVEKAPALWAPQINGKIKSSPISGYGMVEKSSRATLWTAREKKIVQQVVGLFAAGVHREDYHRTHQVPAALATYRRPRVDTTHLPTLSSQQLWTSSSKSSTECHWISVSSIRAPSPSICSISSSGRSSPSSDTTSIASTITSISSPMGSDQESAANLTQELTWHKVSASSSVVALVADEGKSAVSEQSFARPASSRGSRVLASRDLWESRAPVTDSTLNLKSWRSSKVIVSDAFQENLRKEVTAGTKTEENAALTEVTTTTVQFDPSIRHPVSFGSEMVSGAAFVHPAATGYVAQLVTSSAKLSQLWVPSSPIASQASRSASLWTKTGSANDSSDLMIQPAKGNPTRKTTKNLSPLVSQVASSTSFWSPTTSTGSSQHWLHATALRSVPASGATIEQSPLTMALTNMFLEQPQAPKQSEIVLEASTPPSPGRSSTWKAPRRSNTVSGSQGSSLWVPAGNKYQAREKSSAAREVSMERPTSYRHSSMQKVLEKATSTELWRPKWGLSDSPRDWLRSPRATKVDFRW